MMKLSIDGGRPRTILSVDRCLELAGGEEEKPTRFVKEVNSDGEKIFRMV